MSTIPQLESIILARIAEIDARTGADSAVPGPETLEDRRAWEKILGALRRLEETAAEPEDYPGPPRRGRPRGGGKGGLH